MLIERVVPQTVAAVEAYEDREGERPFPGEEDLIATAVDGRRREFLTARRCAREALILLGHPAAPIRSGAARAPQWPSGVVGSITHCAGYRAAVAARDNDLASLGIDAEPNRPLPEGVLESVTVPAERPRLDSLSRQHPDTHWARLLFSAKESNYKAWYPLTGRWLGFEEADLLIDPVAGTFTARILVDGWRRDGGRPLTELSGRFHVARGLVVTAVSVKA